MIIKELAKADIMETPHGMDVRNLYNTEDAMITIISFKPGEALKPHKTPVDVAFYVLEGTGIIQVGDEKTEVSKNTLIESPKKITHCWFNESDELLRVMVIKAPRPVNKSTFVGE